MAQNTEVKKDNTLLFFRTIQRAGVINRRELERRTGLSWGSVSALTNEMLSRGLIIAKKESAVSGRPPESLTINPQTRLSLGIDINSVGLHFNVVNLAGDSIDSAFVEILDSSRTWVLSHLFECIDRLTEKHAIIGINIAMQGKVDRDRGISLRTNFFTDWTDVPLCDLIFERYHIPTRLYHDPEALLMYHLYYDARLFDRKNVIVIRVDDGIGMAQYLNGSVYGSGAANACELGHTISVINGRPCACGRRGCLETYASLRGMRSACGLAPDCDAVYFYGLLNAHDVSAETVFTEACTRMAAAISDLFMLMSPECIVLDGIVPAKCDAYFDRVCEETGKFLLGEPVKLFKAKYRTDAAAIGACLLTIDSNLEEYLG